MTRQLTAETQNSSRLERGREKSSPFILVLPPVLLPPKQLSIPADEPRGSISHLLPRSL